MAPTVVQLMAGIETRLDTIEGLRVDDVKPGLINPPQAVVGVPDIPEYLAAFQRGAWIPDFTITLYVSSANDRVGQLALAEYIDPFGTKSIPAAIWADKTLGGLGVNAVVRSWRAFGRDEIADIGYFGGEFTLKCIASGQ